MELPTATVLVCEENKTRADLYGLWLDEYDVQTSLTKRQLVESVSSTTAVAVVNQSFGDDAESVLEFLESHAPYCRTVATRERTIPLSQRGFDRDLVRPVFEDELVECVETLLYRTNYQLTLQQYYRTTVALSAYEWKADDSAANDERIDRLERRSARLRDFLADLRKNLTDADVRTVVRSISVGDIAGVDSTETLRSKYRPDNCSHCGQDWTTSTEGQKPVTQLGAYVWRCVDCGHVQMYTDPSHRHIGP